MKRRMHLRGRRKKISIFIIIPILLMILFILAFYKYLNIKPLIINYSEIEANKLATLVINSAIKEENAFEKEDLYELKDNIISYNTERINDILTSLTFRIQKYFYAIEKGDIDAIHNNILENYSYKALKEGNIIYIPIGYLTGSSFLANKGIKIPLKIKLIGDVKTDIKENIVDYGLNNALLKIYIYVEVTTKSIIPLISNNQKTIVEYPIVLKIIEGRVPTYYIGNS